MFTLAFAFPKRLAVFSNAHDPNKDIPDFVTELPPHFLDTEKWGGSI